MATVTRREFGRVVIAGLPLAAGLRATPLFGMDNALTLGVSTSSFNDLARVPGRDNVDDVIRALKSVRATHIELALGNVEPPAPNTGPTKGGSAAYPTLIILTPQQIASITAAYRREVRSWRLQSNTAFFDQVRQKFEDARITVHACALEYNDSFTDDEIDATFRQVKSLGVATVSSPMTLAMAQRLAPFAARHGVSVAIHNQVDGNRAGAIATPQLKDALALSPAFALKLDIGNLTASNCDAVAELRTYQSRVSHVLVKDRLRNGGTIQHLGEGDTPIAGVLAQLRTSARSIPAFAEYDYVGVGSSQDEVAASLAYLTALAK